MKKSIFLICFQMALGMLPSFGQTAPQSPVYLSNYTFSNGKPEIGYIKLRSGEETQIKSISLGGEHASFFKVGKDHKLSIRKEKLLPEIHWLAIVLTVKTSAGEAKGTFRIVKDEFIRNKVIAHRGAWKNTGATENSVAALKHAIAMGCEGSEFDVHMSSDSVLFICHDPHMQDISIAKTPAEQLLAIKLANGETFPTLTDYLKGGCGQNKTKLILEIKASELGKASSIALTHKVVELVEKLQAQAWVDYISFDYDVCKEVMKLAPYAKVAYLMGDKSPMELTQEHFFGLDYHFSVLQKNAGWIEQAQQNKLTVNCWTVNDQPLMEELLKAKVDFITTNEPELLLKLISVK
ncbi:MAG: glycerophosphodiester phosphodiesterase family protein [Bacteroidota bacterium]